MSRSRELQVPDGSRRLGKPAGERQLSWRDFFRVFCGAAAASAVVYVYVLYKDPYGRLGIRSSTQSLNLPERELMVTRALDPQFDSAIVGNSTSLPMQPAVLNHLTGYHFVSLSMSGSQSPAALVAARFFLDHHANAKLLIIALDDSWCTNGADADEQRPFPFWLYGGRLDYLIGMAANLSLEMVRTARSTEHGDNRIDGYHPYDEVFRAHDFNNIDVVKEHLNRAKRPTQARYPAPYRFEPPERLRQLIADAPGVTFILLWTPRYLSILPVEGTSAAEADSACKRQVAELSSRAHVVNWSGPRPENLDPANFYEPNHYRDTLAIRIEEDIAQAIKDDHGRGDRTPAASPKLAD
jgi:hypothetical protein